jgi:hypothetical protein
MFEGCMELLWLRDLARGADVLIQMRRGTGGFVPQAHTGQQALNRCLSLGFATRRVTNRDRSRPNSTDRYGSTHGRDKLVGSRRVDRSFGHGSPRWRAIARFRC